MDKCILHLCFLICLFSYQSSHCTSSFYSKPWLPNSCLLLTSRAPAKLFLNLLTYKKLQLWPSATSKSISGSQGHVPTTISEFISQIYLGNLGKKGKEMWDAHLNNQSHKQENLKLELGKGEQKNVQVEWQKREKKVKFSFFNEFVSGCAPLGCRGGLLLLQTAGLFSSCGSQAPLAPERGLQASSLR